MAFCLLLTLSRTPQKDNSMYTITSDAALWVRRSLLISLLLVLCLVPLLPLAAQSPQSTPPSLPAQTPAPPKYVFVPDAPVTVPAGVLTFHPTPPTGPSAAQVLALNAQITTLTAQNTGLQAQVAAAAPTTSGQPFTPRFTENSPGGPRLVFAHFQETAGDYGKGPFYGEYNVNGQAMTFYPGNGPSIAQYRQDIEEAAAAGIDGFAYDLVTYDLSGRGSMWMLLTAADQYNAAHAGTVNAAGVGNFYVFLQYDFAGFPEDAPSIIAQFNEDITHPSYYRYKGRPWLGTYAGEGANAPYGTPATYAQVKAFYGGILAALRAQSPPVNPYFAPFFNIRDAAGNSPSTPQPVSDANEISGVLSGLADAAWLYGTGTGPLLGPNSALQQAEIYSGLLQTAGIKWMGTVTPQYWGAAHADPNRFYCESYGGETLDHQWQSIINAQNASWVQLVTWNDDDEASNFTDADFGPGSPWPYLFHSSVAGYYKSKAGLKALNLYYIQWYKTGVRPTVVSDSIFAFYRTQPIGMSAAQDPLGAIGPTYTEDGGPVTDTLYIVTLVKQTSVLTVTNAGVVTTRTVPAGLYFSRVPFVLGPVSMTLSRYGTTLVTLAGAPIVNEAIVNANYWTGYAHD